jgi:release factor glutamine methyltransferase
VNTAAREILARGAAQLQAAGIESARLDARVLLSEALRVSSDSLFPAGCTPAQIADFEAHIARRAAREPLAYITGRKEFWSLEFEVGPGVLIPRPDSETLVEEALRQFPDPEAAVRVLDIGTGSGCLIVAFLKERPNAFGLGSDSSLAALAHARRNASKHGLSDRCQFEIAPGVAQEFDLILANPPYLTDEEYQASPPEIRKYEPQRAFVAGADGLAGFRDFLPIVVESLAPDGTALFEIGLGQADEVTGIVMDAGLEVRHSVHDLSSIPRCLAVGRVGEGCFRRP